MFVPYGVFMFLTWLMFEPPARTRCFITITLTFLSMLSLFMVVVGCTRVSSLYIFLGWLGITGCAMIFIVHEIRVKKWVRVRLMGDVVAADGHHE
jgi:hypothetical protein